MTFSIPHLRRALSEIFSILLEISEERGCYGFLFFFEFLFFRDEKNLVQQGHTSGEVSGNRLPFRNAPDKGIRMDILEI